MGVLFIGSVFVARLNRDFRPDALLQRAGRGGPVVAGAAFAIAWTPCVGPTLGAILSLASTQVGTWQGALLLAVYSAGLAIPFLFSAVAFNAASRSFVFFKRALRRDPGQLGPGARRDGRPRPQRTAVSPQHRSPAISGPLRAELLPVALAQLR